MIRKNIMKIIVFRNNIVYIHIVKFIICGIEDIHNNTIPDNRDVIIVLS